MEGSARVNEYGLFFMAYESFLNTKVFYLKAPPHASWQTYYTTLLATFKFFAGIVSMLCRLEDFSNRLNLRRVKRRVAHFEALTAMLPALPSL